MGSGSVSRTTGLLRRSAACGSREQLMDECDVVLLPKPVAEDLNAIGAWQGPVGLAALRPG